MLLQLPSLGLENLRQLMIEFLIGLGGAWRAIVHTAQCDRVLREIACDYPGPSTQSPQMARAGPGESW